MFAFSRGYFRPPFHTATVFATDVLTFTPILSRIPFRSYRSLLFKFWTLYVFEPLFGGLRDNVDVHLWLIGKRVVNFLLVSLLQV